MKKILSLTGACFFFLLGVIGLIIPIVPQVPFFVVAFVLAAIGSKKFKNKIKKSKYYQEHIKHRIVQYKYLENIFE